MATLQDLFPDAGKMLALEPEELAGYVLEHLHAMAKSAMPEPPNRHDFVLSVTRSYHVDLRTPHPRDDEIGRSLLEAWSCLERDGLLLPREDNWYFITRRGERLETHTDVDEFRKRSMLPSDLLHPVVAQRTRAAFLRGDYETAIFQAFKEVEVAVRDARGFDATDLGSSLMRKAFDKNSGPLSDLSEVEAERDALSHLFAGGIGRFKNPSSHRTVAIDGDEAIELLFFASYLMRIVDERR